MFFKRLSLVSVLSISALTTTPAAALVEVAFADGAPWDIFTITNSGCTIAAADLTIDLSTSTAGALIDTAYGGAGTQDPMPAELFEGAATLTPVSDGDRAFHLKVATLGKDQSIGVRMDLDDTMATPFSSKIAVSGDEIAGATVSLAVAGQTTTGVFDAQGLAQVSLPTTVPDCQLFS